MFNTFANLPQSRKQKRVRVHFPPPRRRLPGLLSTPLQLCSLSLL